MNCSRCGENSESATNFCRKCGSILKGYDSDITSAITRRVKNRDEFFFPQAAKPVIKTEDTPKAFNPKHKLSKWVSFTKMVTRGAIIGTGAGAIVGLILEVTEYVRGITFGVFTFVSAVFGLLLLGLGLPILKLLIDYGWKDERE